NKSRIVTVAFVLAKNSRRAHTVEDIALPGSILRAIFSQQEIRKTQEEKETIGHERCIDVHLMSLEFSAHAKVVPATRKRDCILPDKGICILVIEGLPRGPERKQTVHRDPRDLGKAQRCVDSNVGGVDRLLSREEAVKPHETEARYVDQTWIKRVGIGQHKHVVGLCLVASPSRHAGSEGREGFI